MTPRIGPPSAPNGHPLADKHFGIPAADGLNVKEAFVVDVLHDQADLIAVPGQHHAERGFRIFDHYHIAVQIGPHLVGEIGHVIADDLLQVAFITRRTGRFQKIFEKFKRGRFQGGALTF